LTEESTLDPSGTRREDGTTDASTADGTRREGMGDGAVLGTRREGVAGGYVRVNLPPELVAVFEVLGEVASGGESDVLLVRRREDGGRAAALKVYRHGLEPDAEALAAIRALPREHVVEIDDCGRSSAGWWEEQEYIEHGSLADMLEREGPRLGAGRLREVVVELASALEAVHPVLHRDVKPTNVFVRTVEPLDLVLGDFGLARSTAFTHIVSTVAGSLAYQSPEALDGGASSARDWWAVGMIVAEAAIGWHPFFDPELGWPSAAEMRIALTTRPVPLDGIDDERVRLLCRGLLVRDPRQRWGAIEVRSWLDGGSPVVAAEVAVRGDGRAATIQPFVFAGQRCTTPEQLAPLLAQYWDDALRLISGAASEAPDYVRLAGWLDEHACEAALRILNAPYDREWSRRLFRLLRAFGPDLPPSFRGYVIDQQGLLELAHDAVNGDENAGGVIRDIVNLGILAELAREDSHQQLEPVERSWREQAELLAELRSELGQLGEPLDDPHVQGISSARLLRAVLERGEVEDLSASVLGAEQGPEFAENEPLRSLFIRTLGAGDEPARLLAALLVREAAREAHASVLAQRAAAEAKARETREREQRLAVEAAQREEGRKRAVAEAIETLVSRGGSVLEMTDFEARIEEVRWRDRRIWHVTSTRAGDVETRYILNGPGRLREVRNATLVLVGAGVVVMFATHPAWFFYTLGVLVLIGVIAVCGWLYGAVNG
jgi:serine/threonine protein kinase